VVYRFFRGNKRGNGLRVEELISRVQILINNVAGGAERKLILVSNADFERIKRKEGRIGNGLWLVACFSYSKERGIGEGYERGWVYFKGKMTKVAFAPKIGELLPRAYHRIF
jgi:hypothetical protein